MKLLHNIGIENHPNYNTREEVLACDEALGFDGVYLNVYENKDILKDKTGVFFVVGDLVGKDNTFDLLNVPKLEKYCTWEQIFEMTRELDFKVGWHTWSHRDLTTLSQEEIIKELTPPFPMKYLAYPYGKYNQKVVDIAYTLGYEMAFSVTQGIENRNDPFYKFKIKREYL